jgi:hypothetical protein
VWGALNSKTRQVEWPGSLGLGSQGTGVAACAAAARVEEVGSAESVTSAEGRSGAPPSC